MLDDLRQAAVDQEDDAFESYEAALAPQANDGKLFGMTAVERMFLAIGLFGVTVIISLILLIATESIYLGF